MTDPSSNLPALLRALGDAEAPPEDAALSTARRRRVVHKIEGTLRAVARARANAERRRRIVVSFSVAAAVLLAVGAATRLRHRDAAVSIGVDPPAAHLREVTGEVTVADEHGALRSLDAGMALRARDTVTTAAAAHARVVLESGVSVEAASATALSLGAPLDPATGHLDEEVRLGKGQVLVDVPKRKDGESFRVRTPDAEVVVHGTSFVVEVCERCGGARGDTAVKVIAGVVAVRQGGKETLVAAGEQWPSRAADDGRTSPPIAPGESAAPPPASALAPPAKSAATKPAESTLGEQNRIYQGALEARRRGDDERMLAMLDDLLARYPKSPLAQAARVERLRCLSRLRENRTTPKP